MQTLRDLFSRVGRKGSYLSVEKNETPLSEPYRLDEVYDDSAFSGRKQETYYQYCDVINDLFEPVSFLDIGCANGFTVGYFKDLGLEARGVEGSESAWKYMPSEIKSWVVKHDLRYPLDLGCRFHLVNCTEVAEHVEPEYETVLVDTIVKHVARWLVFSASPEWDTFRGTPKQEHWNVKPLRYWVKRIEREGVIHRRDLTRRMKQMLAKKPDVYPWWSPRLLIFERRQNKT